MSKTLVILNPVSGNGDGERQWPIIARVLRDGGLDYDLARTEGSDSTVRIAFSAKQSGYETLIAVGGDGTVHQVVNGMFRASSGEPTGRLAIIPMGSGNDLIRMLELVPQWRSGVQLILSGASRWIDIGRLTVTLPKPEQSYETRYFINSLDTGWGARIALRVHEMPLLRGTAKYIAAAFKEMLDYNIPRMRIDLGSEVIEQRSTMVGVGNGRYIGGGFPMNPNAEIDDGLFDICIAQGLSRAQALMFLPKLKQGTHIDDPRVRSMRSDCITIDSPDPLTVETDGEVPYVGIHHIEVQLLPRHLHLLA